LGLVIVSLAAGSFLKNWLHFGSRSPFFILSLAVLVGVPFSMRLAVLQGVKRFGAAISAQIISSTIQIGLAIGLIKAGFGTFGAIAALVLAQTLTLPLLVWNARQHGYKSQWRLLSWPGRALIKELQYSSLVMVVSVITMLLFSS